MTKKLLMRILSGLALSAVLLTANPINAYAESTGTVSVDSAKVRSDASTTSSTVTTAPTGTTVTVTDQTTDSSGNVWYKVTLSNGTTGYIRSDLLTVTEDTSTNTTADDTATDAVDTTSLDSASGAVVPLGGMDIHGIDVTSFLLEDGVNSQDMQLATVNVPAGKIRGGASTNDSIVATLDNGTELLIAGNIVGADSKTWYYVGFLSGGTTQYGYIREDLITMGDMVIFETAQEQETPEEEMVEAEPEPAVNNDYELVYTDDGTGNQVWYLYNHIDNTREKLQELLDFADYQQKVQAENAEKLKLYKLIAIIAGALLVVAIAVIIILLIRSRNSGYDEYDYDDYDDDDDDEDDEEEEQPKFRQTSRLKRRRVEVVEEDEDDEDEDDEPAPVMQNAARRRAAAGNAPRKNVSYDAADDDAVFMPKKSSDKKPKNFMLDDDDFEFEFLNLDNKKK